MQQEQFDQQWDAPTVEEPGAIVPTDWHSSFEQLRAASQAQTLQLRPHQPPAYPVHQPPAPPVYHAPSYGPPSYQAPQYQAPQYQAPQYQAPRYGNYAPEFKPTIIVQTTASSSQDNEHGGRWVFFVLAWFVVVPIVVTLAGGE
jgi:hypothetical protein